MNDGQAVEWPVKRREMHNHHMDSTAWNGFKFRDDDIVVASYAKSDTTLMQQILASSYSTAPRMSVLRKFRPGSISA